MSGCNIFGTVSPTKTIDLAAKDLFPFADELKVDTSAYLTLIFNHSRVTDEEKNFLRNGVKWLNEEAILLYDMVYTKLNATQRENTLKTISQQNWGESWIESILTYTMEAIFSDKIYGVNKEENAHKWLNATMGLPRPKERLL